MPALAITDSKDKIYLSRNEGRIIAARCVRAFVDAYLNKDVKGVEGMENPRLAAHVFKRHLSFTDIVEASARDGGHHLQSDADVVACIALTLQNLAEKRAVPFHDEAKKVFGTDSEAYLEFGAQFLRMQAYFSKCAKVVPQYVPTFVLRHSSVIASNCKRTSIRKVAIG